MSDSTTHYVHFNGATVFVKEAEFFRSQGGLTEDWGRAWRPITARSIGEARRKGAKLFNHRLSHIYLGER